MWDYPGCGSRVVRGLIRFIPVSGCDSGWKRVIKNRAVFDVLMPDCNGVLELSLSSGVFCENGNHCSGHQEFMRGTTPGMTEVNNVDRMEDQGLYPPESTLSA